MRDPGPQLKRTGTESNEKNQSRGKPHKTHCTGMQTEKDHVKRGFRVQAMAVNIEMVLSFSFPWEVTKNY